MPHTIVPFISIKKAKKDATFSIDEDFRNDSSDRKVNLSVGAYKSEEGKAVILKSVKQAEQKVLEGETNKDYLPMSGLKSFTEGARQVLFSGSVESSKIASIQTLSGTGALRVGFEFLAGFGRKVAYVPQQTWANHHAIIKAAGLELREYKYLDTENMRLDFEVRDLPVVSNMSQPPPHPAYRAHTLHLNSFPTGNDG
uniref:Aminotransferase class I/classII large domain-containing protein n=1 Tax=Palpitomonas bilix TaxID=652834 RepID=A0A7S3G0N3_9EUKA|mmetsp:Transcript_19258/g.49326  ORF Transcript_19258/g.49326 Transcript_19258/m.49326 type:complete len:198 (+) Transcript_19258:101-694(+)